MYTLDNWKEKVEGQTTQLEKKFFWVCSIPSLKSNALGPLFCIAEEEHSLSKVNIHYTKHINIMATHLSFISQASKEGNDGVITAITAVDKIAEEDANNNRWEEVKLKSPAGTEQASYCCKCLEIAENLNELEPLDIDALDILGNNLIMNTSTLKHLYQCSPACDKGDVLNCIE